MDGGHVNPHITNVDLVRAIESVRGAGLEVPMISTTLTTCARPTAYPILAISGHTDVHLLPDRLLAVGLACRSNPQKRLLEVRADLAGLLAAGRQYEMIAMLPNRFGGTAGSYVGEAVWDAQVDAGRPRPGPDRILLRSFANAGLGVGSAAGASAPESGGFAGLLLGEERRGVGL